MDEDCVRRALRVLVHYNLIALVDIFQFSNIYVTTEHFQGEPRPHKRHLHPQQHDVTTTHV
jgi:Nitrogen permease regulator 2